MTEIHHGIHNLTELLSVLLRKLIDELVLGEGHDGVLCRLDMEDASAVSGLQFSVLLANLHFVHLVLDGVVFDASSSLELSERSRLDGHDARHEVPEEVLREGRRRKRATVHKAILEVQVVHELRLEVNLLAGKQLIEELISEALSAPSFDLKHDANDGGNELFLVVLGSHVRVHDVHLERVMLALKRMLRAIVSSASSCTVARMEVERHRRERHVVDVRIPFVDDR